jgi:threonine synthase
MHVATLCLTCGAAVAAPRAVACAGCGGPLGFRYAATKPDWDARFAGSLWRFWRLLPLADPAQAVSLGEGGTPLLRSRLALGPALFLKDEARNPTGSHKDRALAIALSVARAQGATTSVVVSAGSTGIANAAYAARAGLASITVMSRGAPPERIYPVQALGSRLIEVDAEIDRLIEAVGALAGRPGLAVASTTRSSNPWQAEGAKTIAYEIVEQLGRAPDWMVVPVGGGSTIAAIHRGFADLVRLGAIARGPRLAAVVPDTHANLAVAWRAGVTEPGPFFALPAADPPTLLTKLAHGHPPDGPEALAAIRESDGVVLAVSQAEAIDGALRLARTDGLYAEPSSGVVLPALERLVADGLARQSETVVALLCGSGFRETFALLPRRPLAIERRSLDELPALLQP